MQTPATAAILMLLPDDPRWVSVRGMILAGRGGPIGPVSADGRSFAAFRPDTGLAQIVGAPPSEQIAAAASGATTVLATPENIGRVRGLLSGWRAEPAVLSVLPAPSLTDPVPPDCRIVTAGDLGEIRRLAPELADEIEAALADGAAVGAAFCDGAPVSFCSADSLTEGLWDVSVDTLASHRRRGFATRAARFMIAWHARSGRRPVWGSAESNPASAGLAKRLGFVAADTIWVLSPPEG